MVMMILAVTLFFALVGMFILVLSLSNLKQKAAILQQDNAKLLVSKIADSPEFSCGNSFGTGMSSCIDLDKVMKLRDVIKNYGNGAFWGIQGLEIRQVYPSNGVECTSSNFPDCGKITLIPFPNTGGTSTSNFVSLCKFYSIGGQPSVKCSLGEVIATYQEAS